MIDGGAGQVSAVHEIMAELGVETKGSTNVSWGTIYAPEQREGEVEIMSGDLSEQVKTLVDRLFEEKVI